MIVTGTFTLRTWISIDFYKSISKRPVYTTIILNSKNISFESTENLRSIPAAPKRPLTPFFKYLAVHRPIVQKQHPDWKPIQITQHIGNDWKHCDVNLKKKIEEEYKSEVIEYRKKREAHSKTLTEEQIDTLKNAKKQVKKKKEKLILKKMQRNEGKPKRPGGVFFFFTNNMRKLPENANLKTVVLMAKYQLDWYLLPQSDKEKYIKMRKDAFVTYQLELKKWKAKMIEEGKESIV